MISFPGVPAREGRGAPGHQAREPPADRGRGAEALRLRAGHRLPAQRQGAAAGAEVRHDALHRPRGALQAQVQRHARRHVELRRGPPRHACRR